MPEGGGTCAIVLAAGFSRRFGDGDKLLAELKGKPLAAYIAATLSELDLAARIAICQSDQGPLADIFRRSGFVIVPNPESAEGQASSLRHGVAAAGARGAESVLLCLADMPFVTKGHLNAVIARGRDDLAASKPDDDGPVSPPAVFSHKHFSALLTLAGDKGARELLRQAPTVICAARELVDCDTIESFDALR